MNYIDELARKIAFKVSDEAPNDEDMRLYRIYALLGLSLGEFVTLRHVHDAWSAWRSATRPDHPSIVPFEQLTEEVQELDRPYRDAIVDVMMGVS